MSSTNKEIITVNIGGAGVNLGKAALEQLCVEQGISRNGYIESKAQYQSAIPISFKETSKGRLYARTLFYDMDPYSINLTKNMYAYSNLLRDANFISGKVDTRNNFAAGHYTDGKCYIDVFNDKLRLMVEDCDDVQGFMVSHSVCGGTGAGTGCLALERIAVDYRRKCKYGFCVFPDDRRLTTAVQVYNTLLCFHWLLDHLEISVILDNWKLDQICKEKLQIKLPRYQHYNNICTKLMSTITSKYRFGLNEDMNSCARDLVPFPRLHFLSASLSPIIPNVKGTNVIYKNDIHSLTDQCLKYSHFFQRFGASGDNYDVEEDKYMALQFHYKGTNVREEVMDVNESMMFMQRNKKFTFVEWMSPKPSVKYIEAPLVSLKGDHIMSGEKRVAMLGNNSAVSRLFAERTVKKHDLLYSQRSYVHFLVGEGMEEGELAEAREDLGFLEKDYLDILSSPQESDYEDSD